MGKLRFLLVLWFTKCTRLFMRLVGRNATYLPGALALKFCPGFMGYMEMPKTVIAVTGSDGKTTTSNMLIDILTRKGLRVMNNQLGSNVPAGIATSFIQSCSLTGRAKCDAAVLEVDERSSHRIFDHVRPDILCITNLFRDSLMRNAHPQYIADFIERAVPEGTRLVLCADDLISNRIAPDNPRVYFGIGPLPTDVKECVNRINDMQICPVCHATLEYDYRRYHHIGRAHCPKCGFASPEADYLAHDVDTAAMTMTVTDRGGSGQYKLVSDSVFNIYNMTAAIAVLREFGMSHEELSEAFTHVSVVSTRYDEEAAGNVRIIMQMSKDKNSLAGSRAFDYVSQKPGDKELILMMNCLHDQISWSENISWLYDCDFEFLNKPNIKRIVCTGPRAKDYVLRLQIAGVPAERILCTEKELDAPSLLEYTPGESVVVFYGTDALDLVAAVREETRKQAERRAAK